MILLFPGDGHDLSIFLFYLQVSGQIISMISKEKLGSNHFIIFRSHMYVEK